MEEEEVLKSVVDNSHSYQKPIKFEVRNDFQLVRIIRNSIRFITSYYLSSNDGIYSYYSRYVRLQNSRLASSAFFYLKIQRFDKTLNLPSYGLTEFCLLKMHVSRIRPSAVI